MFTPEETEAINNAIELINVQVRGTTVTSKISEEILASSKRNAINHHEEHIISLRIKAKRIDVFKIYSWYAFFVAEEIKKQTNLTEREIDVQVFHVFVITINTMNRRLKEQFGKCLSKMKIIFIANLATKDKIQDEHAIGKNGLFLIFTSCVDLIRTDCEE